MELPYWIRYDAIRWCFFLSFTKESQNKTPFSIRWIVCWNFDWNECNFLTFHFDMKIGWNCGMMISLLINYFHWKFLYGQHSIPMDPTNKYQKMSITSFSIAYMAKQKTQWHDLNRCNLARKQRPHEMEQRQWVSIKRTKNHFNFEPQHIFLLNDRFFFSFSLSLSLFLSLPFVFIDPFNFEFCANNNSNNNHNKNKSW